MAGKSDTLRISRLAPSPTGALHLGNARTFLINWVMAKQQNWRLVLRIEDLDGPRNKKGADHQVIEDLNWLGLDWDIGPTYQSHDLSPYEETLSQLERQGLIYHCTCTRRDMELAQSAPHRNDHELRYPGRCRPDATTRPDTSHEPVPPTSPSALRLIVPDELIKFNDELQGLQKINVQQQVGDFIVATKASLPSYQLAVVVDDHRQGVTDVVRGDDLIRSTGRQLWIYRYLDLGPPPRYWHLPLVLGSDGHRLAKRHGDTRLASYRQRGVPSERILGLLAHWCGVTKSRSNLDIDTFAQQFELHQLPSKTVTFTTEDHEWLLAP